MNSLVCSFGSRSWEEAGLDAGHGGGGWTPDAEREGRARGPGVGRKARAEGRG